MKTVSFNGKWKGKVEVKELKIIGTFQKIIK